MESIEFFCNLCNTRYKVPTKLSGKKIQCKECDTINIVPSEKTEEPEYSTDSIDVSRSKLPLIMVHLPISGYK